MVLPGHLAGGYLATEILLYITTASFSPTQTVILLIIGTLTGDGPDIDLFWYYLENTDKTHPGKTNNHREYLTHAPLTWLIFCILIILAGLIASSTFTIFVGLTILVGSWSHFILDSIEFGIRWFWPFSNKRYYLHKTVEIEPGGQKGTFSYYWKMITSPEFLKSWSLYAEIVIIIIALAVFIAQVGTR